MRIILFVLLLSWSLGGSKNEPVCFAEDYPAIEGKINKELMARPILLPPGKVVVPGVTDAEKAPAPVGCTNLFGDSSSGTAFKLAKLQNKVKKLVNPNIPKGLEEVEAKYAAAKTLVADFTQVQTNALTQTKKTTSGVIKFKIPDKVFWQTKAPDQNLLVGDGTTFWFFTPPFDETEKGSVIIRKSAEVQSKIAQILLSGSFSQAKGVKIKDKGKGKYSLDFKKAAAGTAKSADLYVQPESKQVERVVIFNKEGNVSDIQLSKIEFGLEIPDGEFQFKVPEGADVNRGE